MLKSLIPIVAAAISVSSVPILPVCVPTLLYDVPGFTCPIYNPFVRRYVPGPFVPYTPYIQNARTVDQYQYEFASGQLDYYHNWQDKQLQNQNEFFQNNQWTKPYGYDAFHSQQKEWLNAHQNIQTQNLNTAHENREAFLNAQESG